MNNTIENIEIPEGWRLQNMHQKCGMFYCTLEPLTCTTCRMGVSSFGKTIGETLRAAIEKIKTNEKNFADIRAAIGI